MLDNRLRPGSRKKVRSAYRRWFRFCAEHGWSPLLETGSKVRGGRLAAWVLSMTDDTDLVYKSIACYVWGVRTWHVLMHQADPAFGVMFWREFMMGTSVLTAVPSEPREMVPLEVLNAVLDKLDKSIFEEAQLGLMLLTLVLTFSRTECPCPKTWTGEDKFDPMGTRSGRVGQ